MIYFNIKYILNFERKCICITLRLQPKIAHKDSIVLLVHCAQLKANVLQDPVVRINLIGFLCIQQPVKIISHLKE